MSIVTNQNKIRSGRVTFSSCQALHTQKDVIVFDFLLIKTWKSQSFQPIPVCLIVLRFVSSLRHLRRVVHFPPHSDHRQQFQQILRKSENRGRNRSQEKENILGRCQKRQLNQKQPFPVFVFFCFCKFVANKIPDYERSRFSKQAKPYLLITFHLKAH